MGAGLSPGWAREALFVLLRQARVQWRDRSSLHPQHHKALLSPEWWLRQAGFCSHSPGCVCVAGAVQPIPGLTQTSHQQYVTIFTSIWLLGKLRPTISPRFQAQKVAEPVLEAGFLYFGECQSQTTIPVPASVSPPAPAEVPPAPTSCSLLLACPLYPKGDGCHVNGKAYDLPEASQGRGHTGLRPS